MKTPKFLSLLLGTIIFSFLLNACQRTKSVPPDRPNIILIYTDQQRFNTLHAFGNETIITPNLDRLAQRGIALTNTFAPSPVCKPSRTSIMTGQYPSSHKAYSNHHSSGRASTSLPLSLKQAGYQTVVAGKNHTFLDHTDIDRFLDAPTDPNGKPADGRSGEKATPWSLEDDPMHRLTDSALRYMNQHLVNSKSSQPLFLWLSYVYPHTPYMAPEPYYSLYDSIAIPEPQLEPEGLEAANKPFRHLFHAHNTQQLLPYDRAQTLRMKRTYYGMITLVDHEIGRLLDYLETQGIADNTLLIFTSDHGDYMGDHHMYTKSPALYDCLLHVPMIVSWPGKFQENLRSDALISHVDVFATLMDALTLAIPEEVEGGSFLPLLKGEANYQEQAYVFAEYGLPGGPPIQSFEELKTYLPKYPEVPLSWAQGIPWEGNPVSLAGEIKMIRSKTHKLVYERGGQSELYDLVADPYELKNLWDEPEYQKIQTQLLADLALWSKERVPATDSISQQNLELLMQRRKQGLSPKGMYRNSH